ncbi:hypothetical protein IMY05_C4897000100 [Salix suchowensis]|nr:hypothetical protein IMY05_C4897000100 [Salix suchowensis]
MRTHSIVLLIHQQHILSELFIRGHGDIILCSCDGVDFQVYKVIMLVASPMFCNMFSLPDSPVVSRKKQWFDHIEHVCTSIVAKGPKKAFKYIDLHQAAVNVIALGCSVCQKAVIEKLHELSVSLAKHAQCAVDRVRLFFHHPHQNAFINCSWLQNHSSEDMVTSYFLHNHTNFLVYKGAMLAVSSSTTCSRYLIQQVPPMEQYGLSHRFRLSQLAQESARCCLDYTLTELVDQDTYPQAITIGSFSTIKNIPKNVRSTWTAQILYGSVGKFGHEDAVGQKRK